MPSPQRAAVIDIGSNSVSLLVADCFPDRIESVYTERMRMGLGAVVAAKGVLGPRRTKASAGLVGGFAVRANSFGASALIVLGTHPVRAALDGQAFAHAIQEATGTVLHVLSPEQEAALCLAGASLGPLPHPTFLFADIGGGSCELAVVNELGIDAIASISTGSGVLAATRLTRDPPKASSLSAAQALVHDLLDPIRFEGRRTFREMVVTGGAARRLGRQANVLGDEASAAVGPLLNLSDRLLGSPSRTWPVVITAKRAAVARAGAVILRAIITRWRIQAWRVSAFGLREGALVSWVRGLAPDAHPAEVARMRGHQ